MKYNIVDERSCLEVHITLERPYKLVKEAFDRALANFQLTNPELVETTMGEQGKHRFELQDRGILEPDIRDFRAAVTFFDDARPSTRVVIENRKSDGFCANGLRGSVRLVVGTFCKRCVDQGDMGMTAAEMANLLLELEPHVKI